MNTEHIIPLSLGGLLELPEASCPSCEKITHRFERTCARDIFGKFRIRHNLPTRRKKERPKELIALAAADRTGKNLKTVPLKASEYPTELFLYTFKQANALFGLPSHIDTLEWNIVGINSHEEMLAFEKKYGGAFATQVKFFPIEFARMVAKIGHGFAVAHLGLAAFAPLALNLILGRTNNVSHVVGAHPEVEPPIPDAGHVLSLEYRPKPQSSGALILVQIRLFASLHTPTYHVVVGEMASFEHAVSLIKSIHDSQNKIETSANKRSPEGAQRIPDSTQLP